MVSDFAAKAQQFKDIRQCGSFFFFSDVTICAHTSVSLHLVGMSSHPDVFSVHINGQVLQQSGHKVSSVGLISGSTATVSMVAVHTGRWLVSSHTIKHIEGTTKTPHIHLGPKTFARGNVTLPHNFALQLECTASWT